MVTHVYLLYAVDDWVGGTMGGFRTEEDLLGVYKSRAAAQEGANRKHAYGPLEGEWKPDEDNPGEWRLYDYKIVRMQVLG